MGGSFSITTRSRDNRVYNSENTSGEWNLGEKGICEIAGKDVHSFLVNVRGKYSLVGKDGSDKFCKSWSEYLIFH